MSKLTIGMLVYDDYDGVYFTLQSLRMNNRHLSDQIEYIIINNNKSGLHTKALKALGHLDGVKYIEAETNGGTSSRNSIFNQAKGEYVLCVDCHVIFQHDAIEKLFKYFEAGKDCGNLIQGPLMHDNAIQVSTHFTSAWSMHMHGQWAPGVNILSNDDDPLIIEGQGLGVFACRKDSWLGFNKHFEGFGGEEMYIHEKYRQAGKCTICLPFLNWMHRFERVNGIPYPNNLHIRFKNYIIGHNELGLDPTNVIDAFYPPLLKSDVVNILKEANKLEPPKRTFNLNIV